MEKARILVVEDDKDINGLIAYNLRKNGFLVEQVFDGDEAKEKLDSEFFSIVILDIMLPGIDGFDICRDIKESITGHKSYVIMVSAKGSEQDKLYAHILGADCYIQKPFFVKDLISIVDEISVLLKKDYTVAP
ncbi:MAG: response regulator [Candidatus Omnitrophota bacterium]|jgi:two-component system alkaline phosphatase synthesis response regulator PhoP|nr:response regulator [Candidatus Omnitrophota bacterium]MDD5665154.1 response regulator [Candidatus Omnitrophota bacterium]